MRRHAFTDVSLDKAPRLASRSAYKRKQGRIVGHATHHVLNSSPAKATLRHEPPLSLLKSGWALWTSAHERASLAENRTAIPQSPCLNGVACAPMVPCPPAVRRSILTSPHASGISWRPKGLCPPSMRSSVPTNPCSSGGSCTPRACARRPCGTPSRRACAQVGSPVHRWPDGHAPAGPPVLLRVRWPGGARSEPDVRRECLRPLARHAR